MNTYQYGVNSLTCLAKDAQGHENVVTDVLWTLSGTDGKGHNASVTTSTPMVYDEKDPFIPYDQLTMDIVLGWVRDQVGPDGIATIEANLDAQIAALANPPIVTPPLPW